MAGRFLSEANTLPVGLSVDSRHSHACWAASLGGVSFPLLSDFNPHAKVSDALGIYLAHDGVSDRCTLILERGTGRVLYAASAGLSGLRKADELLAMATRLGSPGAPFVRPAPPARPATLYVREGCGHCQAAACAVTNLHLDPGYVVVRDIGRDAAARDALRALGAPAVTPTLDPGDGRAPLRGVAQIVPPLADRFALR